MVTGRRRRPSSLRGEGERRTKPGRGTVIDRIGLGALAASGSHAGVVEEVVESAGAPSSLRLRMSMNWMGAIAVAPSSWIFSLTTASPLISADTVAPASVRSIA